MVATQRFTSADLEVLPEDTKRYEIVDGELFVSRMPHSYHQMVCSNVIGPLWIWSGETKLGHVLPTPGLVFAEDDDVVPDVAWISMLRWLRVLDAAGHLTDAPELVVEVLSPGSENVRRDRESKLKLYSRRGVLEYWIIDWLLRTVEIYRRNETGLTLVHTLAPGDSIESPILPGFTALVGAFFAGLP
jgi:Uma2 family endonuclease